MFIRHIVHGLLPDNLTKALSHVMLRNGQKKVGFSGPTESGLDIWILLRIAIQEHLGPLRSTRPAVSRWWAYSLSTTLHYRQLFSGSQLSYSHALMAIELYEYGYATRVSWCCYIVKSRKFRLVVHQGREALFNNMRLEPTILLRCWEECFGRTVWSGTGYASNKKGELVTSSARDCLLTEPSRSQTSQ